ARLREPDLPLAGQSYCRKVTIVWAVWLSANTIIAAALALAANDEAWAIWTGFIAYLVMGALFAGEMAVRHIVRRRAVKPRACLGFRVCWWMAARLRRRSPRAVPR